MADNTYDTSEKDIFAQWQSLLSLKASDLALPIQWYGVPIGLTGEEARSNFITFRDRVRQVETELNANGR
jgi:hypothetical protein